MRLFYSALPSHWLKTSMISLVGWHPCFWYGRPIQWWGVRPNRAPPPLPLLFPKLRHWGLPGMICGFHIGSYQIGRTSWLPPLLMTGVIENLLVLFPLFCLYPHGDGIGWQYRWSPGTLIHNPGDFPYRLPRPHPSFRWRWPGCCCCAILLCVSILRRTLGE